MPAERPEVPSDNNQPPRSKQRLRLIESYNAFSDEKLQDISDKIQSITSRISSPLSPISPNQSSNYTSDYSPNESPNSSPNRLGETLDDSLNDISKSLGDETRETPYSPNESPNYSPNRLGETLDDSFGNQLGEISDDPLDDSSTSQHQSPNEKNSTQFSSESILLTDNQAILYFCLKHISGAVTSLTHIAKATSISEHTLKSCLKKLRREHLIEYGGRCNYGGRFGFTAKTNEKQIILRGDKNKLTKKLQRIDFRLLIFSEPINDLDLSIPLSEETDHLMDHRINNQMSHPIIDRMNNSSSSSNKNKLLLQDIIFEEAFQTLHPHSLSPYLEHFATEEELQDFLDMANACITAAKQGKSKPIQNAHGFLFAQLRAGYINPPEGYKSRRVRAQEARNQQLRAEVERLKNLQEEEQHLRFTLFVTALTAEDEQRLRQEIHHRVDPKGMLSPEFQTRLLREQILQEWFRQKHGGGPLTTPPVTEESEQSGPKS